MSGASGLATTISLPSSDSVFENQLTGDNTVRGEYLNDDEDYFIW